MSVIKFREIISKDHPEFKPEADRYVLYSAQSCGQVHLALLVRALKKLENIVQVVYANTSYDSEKGWVFDEAEPIIGAKLVKDIYRSCDQTYEARGPLPMLFDKKTKNIVNCDQDDIVRILNTSFNELLGPRTVDIWPTKLQPEIEVLKGWIMSDLLMGIFKTMSAANQADYEATTRTVFGALDRIEALLGERSWLAGDVVSYIDLMLFPIMVRIAPCYEPLLRLNLKSLRSDDDYPNTKQWMRKIYQMPGVQQTMDMDQIVVGILNGKKNVFPGGNVLIPLYRGPDLAKPEAKVSDKDFAWF